MVSSSVVPGLDKASSVVEAMRGLVGEPVSANAMTPHAPPGGPVPQGINTSVCLKRHCQKNGSEADAPRRSYQDHPIGLGPDMDQPQSLPNAPHSADLGNT